MNNKLKSRFFSLLFFVLVIVVIAGVIMMFFWLKSESAMCLKDPIQYITEKSSNTCFCYNPLK